MTGLIERLRECPSCGEPEELALHSRQEDEGPYLWVTCYVCGSEGPKRQTPERAIAAWNTRKSDSTIEALVDALRAVPLPGKTEDVERFYHRMNVWLDGPYRSVLSRIDTLPATQDQGVAADAAGLSPSVEPLRVSPPDGASIPNAGDQ